MCTKWLNKQEGHLFTYNFNKSPGAADPHQADVNHMKEVVGHAAIKPHLEPLVRPDGHVPAKGASKNKSTLDLANPDKGAPMFSPKGTDTIY